MTYTRNTTRNIVLSVLLGLAFTLSANAQGVFQDTAGPSLKSKSFAKSMVEDRENALRSRYVRLDTEQVAKALGFDGVTANSMDTSGDRDYAIEFTSDCTMIQLHLSRLSEELVLWSSQEFNFVNISDKFCTGSSIMPQKKNPDIPELIRGKSGRVVGSLITLITLMKGLPLTYNRDLQEDKEPVFDTVDTVSASLSIMAELLENLSFNTAQMAEATQTGCITATDLVGHLAEVLQRRPQHRARLPVLRKLELRPEHRRVRLDEGVALVADDRWRQRLALESGQLGLGVEQFELARCAGHEQVDDGLRRGLEVRNLGG